MGKVRPEKVKALTDVNVFCPGCGRVMIRGRSEDVATIHCGNPACNYYLYPYQAPHILLRPINEKKQSMTFTITPQDNRTAFVPIPLENPFLVPNR